jgi:hypothetical protein
LNVPALRLQRIVVQNDLSVKNFSALQAIHAIKLWLRSTLFFRAVAARSPHARTWGGVKAPLLIGMHPLLERTVDLPGSIGRHKLNRRLQIRRPTRWGFLRTRHHRFPWASSFFLTISAPLCDVNAKPIRSRPQIELQAVARRVDHEKGCSRNIREGTRQI